MRPGKSHQGSFGGDRGLGVVVVMALRESGAGKPNGPPSPRLAPGGFYEKGDWLRVKRGACTLFQLEDAQNTGSRAVGPGRYIVRLRGAFALALVRLALM